MTITINMGNVIWRTDTKTNEHHNNSASITGEMPCNSDAETDNTIDAIGSADENADIVKFSTNISRITEQKVRDIERYLELDEKISLVYLLYESPVDALEEIYRLQKNESKYPIADWAIHENKFNDSWKKKLVEALAIIQDYRILKILGCDKKQVKDTYLPLNRLITCYINPIRKVLFCIFDNLTCDNRKRFLELVEKDFSTLGKCLKKYDNFYVEIYLLRFEADSYFTKINVENITKIFKQMQMFAECDDLKNIETQCSHNEVTRKNSMQANGPPSFQNFQDSAASIPFIQGSSTDQRALEPYKMNSQKPGVCLIINQMYFYKEVDKRYKNLLTNKELAVRYGTNMDRDRLKSAFKFCKFREEDIIVKEKNLDHEKMIDAVKEAVDRVQDHSSLFVCILSHGEEGVVYAANSCAVKIDEIKKVMSSRNKTHLDNKPKVLILQSCRGTETQKIQVQEDYDDDDFEFDSPSAPQYLDMLTFFATIRGYAAVRNKTSGSWFIQTFCKMMEQYAHCSHFEEICTKTTSEVTKNKWKKDSDEICMVSEKQSTFTKALYFPVTA